MPASKRRYLVLAALFVLSLITYIDRAAISSAKGAMAAELALSDAAMGAVFSAFALGYALAQIPSGWIADRVGPRLALTLVVVVWSMLTSLTGAVSQLTTLLAVRFIFGVAEAGAFPGSARVFYNWLPAKERGIANGILFSGALVGGAVAFPFFGWLLGSHGWRTAFYFLGVPGFVWAICWFTWFRDHPAGKPAAPEPARIEPGARPEARLGQVFRSGPMLKAMAQYFAGNFTFFICLTWMLPYLVDHYGLGSQDASQYAMVPLLAGASANWVAGFFVDALYRSRFRRWSRQVPAIIGFALAAGGVFAVTLVTSPEGAVVAFAIATFGVEMTISPSWSYCIDIGGKNSGAVSGAMNTVGNIGAFVSANAFPLLRGLTGSAATYFQTAALLNALSILCWLTMRSVGRLDTPPVPAPISPAAPPSHDRTPRDR